MAFQPVPDTAKFAVVMDRAGELMVNTFHASRGGLWGAPQLTQAAQAILNAWTGQVMPNLHQSVTLQRVEARGLRSQADVTVTLLPVNPVSGGRGDDAVPGNVAFCVTHTTGLTGRFARGRTYFGGFSEADVSFDSLAPSRANNLVNALVILQDFLQNVGWTMVVVSRYLNKELRPAGFTIPVTGFRYADTILDSQRRRLAGRGR